MRLLTASLLLFLHGTAAFLGHAGLHALQGTGACQHHAHVATDEHACCHHHHGHSQEAPGHSHDGGVPDHKFPADHDHDDCLICQWHVQAKVSLTAPVLVEIDAPSFDVVCVDEDVDTLLTPLAVRSRGPPLCG